MLSVLVISLYSCPLHWSPGAVCRSLPTEQPWVVLIGSICSVCHWVTLPQRISWCAWAQHWPQSERAHCGSWRLFEMRMTCLSLVILALIILLYIVVPAKHTQDASKPSRTNHSRRTIRRLGRCIALAGGCTRCHWFRSFSIPNNILIYKRLL